MTEKSYIVFRADGNVDIGLGHIMRCLTLAKIFSDSEYKILFICSKVSEFIGNVINSRNYKLEEIEGTFVSSFEDAKKSLKAIENINVEMLVVDHYALDSRWEKDLIDNVNKLMVIDDLANRSHHCDYLLDSSYGRLPDDYRKISNSNCKLLLGVDYCLLRPDFFSLRPAAIKKRKATTEIQSVLINFGGTDLQNLSIKTFSYLVESSYQGDVHILIASSCQYLQELIAAEKKFNNLNLHIDEQQVAKLMLNADIAIGSVGTSSWERCCMGLPTIGVIVASNQNNIAQQLANIGVMILSSRDDLRENINTYISEIDLVTWHKISNKAFEVCDGIGALRVANTVLDPPVNISLLEMDTRHEDLLYTWQCETGNRQYSGNPAIPSLKEHKFWFKASLENSNRRMWLIVFNNSKCGYVRLDRQDKSEEISVLISQTFRKLGLANAAINQLKTLSHFNIIEAEVAETNLASSALFQKLDFKKISNTRYQWVKP